MATLGAVPARRLGLALRRLSARHRCTSSLQRPAIGLAARAFAPVASSTQPHLANQQRGFWPFSGSKGGGDGEDKPPGDASEVSSSSASSTKGKGEVAAAEPSSKSSVELAASEGDADAKDGAIVPVKPAALKRDSGPPLEPNMVLLPLVRRPLFPGQQQLLQVNHPDVIKKIMKGFSGDSPLFVATFLRRDSSLPEPQGAEIPPISEDFSGIDPFEALHLTGTRARVVHAAPFSLQGKTGANGGANGSASGGEKDASAHGLQILLSGQDLIRLDKVLDLGPPLQVHVSRVEQKSVPDKGPAADEVRAHINEIMHTIREIMKINPHFREHASLIHQGMERLERGDPHAIAHFAACLTTSAGAELMEVLEAEFPADKLRTVLTLVKKELELSQIQAKISTQIEEKVSSTQREFMLREQLKMLKKELGEDKSDGSDALLQKFKTRLEGKTLPDDANEAIDSEVSKFSGLAKESQEYQITRNYLDWLTVLPWGVFSKDTLSLRKARSILDKDHYGLADVKERILEMIAVGRLRGSVQGKIVCFVGPPGVGKTSIGKSIAQALGREFYRFSVGGLYDVAEIKGHRRTYVGAMPGKVVQCLKKTQSSNPLVLIDEVDKIGRGHQGDPASALLELLDPSQNGAFLDHYLDVPVDCSKILFVCTANVTDTIPGPLLDRMEVIRLSGYDLQEKLKIAEDYLVPASMREMGLWSSSIPDAATKTEQVTERDEGAATKTDDSAKDRVLPGAPKATEAEPSDCKATTEASTCASDDGDKERGSAPEAAIEKDAVEALIRWYCREAGVRNLQKHIEKICRKLAMQVVEHREATEDAKESEKEAPSLTVTEDKLSDLIGKPPFTSDRLYEGTLPAGTVTGLAWTAMGGSVLYMEASALLRLDGKTSTPSLSVTGKLGEVMKESSQLAFLLARRHLRDIAPTSQQKFFEEHEIHLHCPEGAVPKDGPSAGITMVTALLSLALDVPARADLAMTGEISLNGKVLAIGGLKEKTIAARRAGCKVLIFPQANRRDFDELPAYLKDDLEVHFATEFSDVATVAFPDLPKLQAPGSVEAT